MSGSDLRKKREILFSKFPPGQVPEAADDLQRLEELGDQLLLCADGEAWLVQVRAMFP